MVASFFNVIKKATCLNVFYIRFKYFASQKQLNYIIFAFFIPETELRKLFSFEFGEGK